MRRHKRTWVTSSGLVMFAVLLVGVLSAYGLKARAADNPPPQDGQPDQAVVDTYFQIFNAGLLSGDFSALATVYAPDATLVQTNSKNVVTIKQGVSDIVAWYTATFGRGTPAHGAQFVPDPRYPPLSSLAPHVVLTHEYALPPGFSQAGYCMHVFTLKGGWIYTVNWVTYYGPVK
jgi:hypothetical protein